MIIATSRDWAIAFPPCRSFQDWKRERFWELAMEGNPRISYQPRFLDAWWNIALGEHLQPSGRPHVRS